HAVYETVLIALEVEAVLEWARLAFVGIDRKQARRRLGAHQRPFTPGGKTGAAEPAQSGIADDLDDLVARTRTGKTRFEKLITAAARIDFERGRRRIDVRMRRVRRSGRHFGCIGVHDLHMADRANRSAVAGTHARSAHNAHGGSELARQIGEKPLSAGKRARQ